MPRCTPMEKLAPHPAHRIHSAEQILSRAVRVVAPLVLLAIGLEALLDERPRFRVHERGDEAFDVYPVGLGVRSLFLLPPSSDASRPRGSSGSRSACPRRARSQR